MHFHRTKKRRCKRPSGGGQFVKRQELGKVKDALVVLCNQVRRVMSSRTVDLFAYYHQKFIITAVDTRGK